MSKTYHSEFYPGCDAPGCYHVASSKHIVLDAAGFKLMMESNQDSCCRVCKRDFFNKEGDSRINESQS